MTFGAFWGGMTHDWRALKARRRYREVRGMLRREIRGQMTYSGRLVSYKSCLICEKNVLTLMGNIDIFQDSDNMLRKNYYKSHNISTYMYISLKQIGVHTFVLDHKDQVRNSLR